MNVSATVLPEVKVLTPQVFSDSRGSFFESWNHRAFSALGVTEEFVQDNHSISTHLALRGLHYQIQQPQGKLVRVVRGEVFDVVVDIRRSSANFGKSVGERLSQENRKLLWVPPGFAHGFLVLSDEAEFLYKCTDYYAPEYERTLLWNDSDLNIAWPLKSRQVPVLSDKDLSGSSFAEAEVYP